MKRLKSMAAIGAIFFAFAFGGLNAKNVDVRAKDSMAFNVSELSNNKSFKNKKIAETPDFTLTAGNQNGKVLKAKSNVFANEHSFTKGYVVNANNEGMGVKVTAKEDNTEIKVYYTVSDQTNFKNGKIRTGSLKIWESDGDVVTSKAVSPTNTMTMALDEDEYTSSCYENASYYTYIIENANDYIWLGTSNQSLVIYGIESMITNGVVDDTTTSNSKAILNKHLDATSLKGNFKKNQELCTSEELGYYFEPYKNANIYKYSSNKKAENAEYIKVEPSNSGIQFYVSSDVTTVSFEVGASGLATAFGLLNVDTGKYVESTSDDVLQRLFTNEYQYYAMGKINVSYELSEVGTYAIVFPSMLGSTGGVIYSIDVNMEVEALFEERIIDDNFGTIEFVGTIKGVNALNFVDFESAYFGIEISNVTSFEYQITTAYEAATDYGRAAELNTMYMVGRIEGVYASEALLGQCVNAYLSITLSTGTIITTGNVSGFINGGMN